MTIYIYSRVSTVDQNSAQQAQYLSGKYPNDIIIEETFTGTTTNRPKFQKLLGSLSRGDTLIVKEVSRIGRNTAEVLEVAEALKANGVHLIIDQLGGMDVTSPSGELMLTMMAGIAKLEREMMLERQAIGIARAKSEGKYKGRKSLDSTLIDTAKTLIAGGMSKVKAAKQLNIGESTLYKYLAAE